MTNFEFSEYIWFFLPLFFYFLYTLKKPLYKQKSSFSVPYQIQKQPKFYDYSSKIFPYLRFLSLIFFLIALIGPSKKSFLLPDKTKGIDIMIALDISASMTRSRDFLPRSRLEVSKILLQNFIEQRKKDRLGLVIFSGAAYLQAPLTNDGFALQEILSYIHEGYIEEQGTAIGDAILLATYRLKDSKSNSKTLILITDGVSNTGKIDARTATQIAKSYQVKIYSIGIGREEGQFGINFGILKEISNFTQGNFFRAETPKQLQQVLTTIDNLEKTELDVRPKEIIERDFEKYLWIGIFILTIELFLKSFIFRYY